MFTQAQINAIVAAFQTALQALVAQPAPIPTPEPVAPAVDPAAARIAAIEAELAAAKAALKPAPVAPAPVMAPRGPTYSQDAAGYRVDDVALPGTPGTVTLPVTGHVVSLPQPNAQHPERGEMLMGYIMRVYKQCGGKESDRFAVGPLSLPKSPDGVHHPDGTYWPEMADRFYNPVAYMTPDQREEAAKQAQQWAYVNQKLAEHYEAKTPRREQPEPPRPGVGEDVAIGG